MSEREIDKLNIKKNWSQLVSDKKLSEELVNYFKKHFKKDTESYVYSSAFEIFDGEVVKKDLDSAML